MRMERSGARGYGYTVWANYYKKLFSSLPAKDAKLLFDLIYHTDEGPMEWSNSLGEVERRLVNGEYKSYPVPLPKTAADIDARKKKLIGGLLCGVSLDYDELFSKSFKLKKARDVDPSNRNTILFVSMISPGRDNTIGVAQALTDEVCKQDKGNRGSIGFVFHNLDKEDYALVGELYPKEIEDKLQEKFGCDDGPDIPDMPPELYPPIDKKHSAPDTPIRFDPSLIGQPLFTNSNSKKGQSNQKQEPTEPEDTSDEDELVRLEEKRKSIFFGNEATLSKMREYIKKFSDFEQNSALTKVYHVKTIPHVILLYGAPKVGKTSILRRIVKGSPFGVYLTSPNTLISFSFQDTADNIKELCKVTSRNLPCIIYVEDVDEFKRGGDKAFFALNEFFETFSNNTKILFILSTDHPLSVPSFLFGRNRIEEVVYVDPPTYPERVRILESYLGTMPCSETIDFSLIAKSTEGFTGYDLERLCSEAGRLALKETVGSIENIKLVQNIHLKKALNVVSPSITPVLLSEYAQFEKIHGKKI